MSGVAAFQPPVVPDEQKACNDFKKTEIGFIPIDWEVEPASAVCDQVVDCKNRTPPVVDSGDFAVVRTPNVRNGKFVRNELRFTNETSYREWTARAVPTIGDVLITREAPLGEVCLVPENLKVCLGQRMMLYRPNSARLHPRYLLFALMSAGVQEALQKQIGGSTVGHAKVDDIRNLLLPIPATTKEQEAIAEALSDADALIEGLESLIAKKRAVKQGAMQELLTGKRRLPGFTGEWKRFLMPDVCWFQEGPGVRTHQFTSQGVKLLNGTNIVRGHLELDSTNRFISEKEASGPYSHFLAEVDDIVIASSGITIDRFHEKVALVTVQDLPLCMNTSTIRFKPNREALDRHFLFQFLMSIEFKRQIGGQATGSAQLNFGPSHVSKVEVNLPSVDEQAAVANALANMDAEITTLESKLAKAKQVKQGMMQELLTGRIRLV